MAGHELIYSELTIQDKVELDLHISKILFMRINDHLVEVNAIYDNKSETIMLNINRDDIIYLRPEPPSGLKVNVNKVMVLITGGIIIPPTRSLTLDLKIPVDVGIYLGNTLVLKTPLSRVKYSLYGPPNIGVLCRYVNGKILSTSTPETTGIIRIDVNNLSSENIKLNKLVLPSEGLGVYIAEDGKLVFNRVRVRVHDSIKAEVETDDAPSLNGVGYKYSPLIKKASYLMLYGY